MKSGNITTLALLGAALAACGGGGGGAAAPAPTPLAPTVSNVSTDALMYGKSARITVSGQHLDQGIAVTAPACAGISEAGGGSATQRVYSCTPGATGAMAITVTSSAGTALASLAPLVPPPQVTMKTSQGELVLELYPANAPLTVNNFLKYVNASFYNNLIFHRVMPGFVIQGGGFNAALQPAATSAPVKLEMPNGLSNMRGTLAMARTSVADSATSQFFINLVDNVGLDTAGGGYAVFGKVLTGLATVDLIAKQPTQSSSGLDNVPVTPVVISSAVQTQ